MLLNIFFDSMNSTLELLLTGAFFFALYWFIMRKYNSLGLRMLVLCCSLFIACCVWIYKDEVRLKNTIASGEERPATILGKEKVGNNDNEVRLSFTGEDGEVTTKTKMYISAEEWARFENGGTIPVIYLPGTGETFIKESLLRFKKEKIYLYYFAGFWLLLGLALYFWLRKLKVGVDENSGAEYVIKEDGSIILDERKSATARTMKRVNILSKMAQAFGK